MKTDSNQSISMLKRGIPGCKGLLLHGEELLDGKLVCEYVLQTGSIVTETCPTFMEVLAVSVSGASQVDMCVHPNTKVKKLGTKLRKWLDVPCELEFLVRQELQESASVSSFFTSMQADFHLVPQ